MFKFRFRIRSFALCPHTSNRPLTHTDRIRSPLRYGFDLKIVFAHNNRSHRMAPTELLPRVVRILQGIVTDNSAPYSQNFVIENYQKIQLNFESIDRSASACALRSANLSSSNNLFIIPRAAMVSNSFVDNLNDSWMIVNNTKSNDLLIDSWLILSCPFWSLNRSKF